MNSTDGGRVEVYTTGDPAVIGKASFDRRPFVLPPKRRPEELPERLEKHRASVDQARDRLAVAGKLTRWWWRGSLRAVHRIGASS